MKILWAEAEMVMPSPKFFFRRTGIGYIFGPPAKTCMPQVSGLVLNFAYYYFNFTYF